MKLREIEGKVRRLKVTAVRRGEYWAEGEGCGKCNVRGESRQLQCISHWFSYFMEGFTETNHFLTMAVYWYMVYWHCKMLHPSQIDLICQIKKSDPDLESKLCAKNTEK